VPKIFLFKKNTLKRCPKIKKEILNAYPPPYAPTFIHTLPGNEER